MSAGGGKTRMRAQDCRLAADFMEAVERERPDWAVSLADASDDMFRLSVKAGGGAHLTSPLPVSVERARGDISEAVTSFVKAASGRLYAATGRW